MSTIEQLLTKPQYGWSWDLEQILRIRIADIRERPAAHRHRSVDEALECCAVHGVLSDLLREMHRLFADGRRDPTDAELIGKIDDILRRPEAHDHWGMSELNDCCLVAGAFRWHLLEFHGIFATLGHNPSEPCDMYSGPCACGATHAWGRRR